MWKKGLARLQSEHDFDIVEWKSRTQDVDLIQLD